MKRILLVVSNVSHYDDVSQPTGLWLSELTHAYHVWKIVAYVRHLPKPTPAEEQQVLKQAEEPMQHCIQPREH